jgi:PilZ domain
MRVKEELGFKRIHERRKYAVEVIFSHGDKAYAGRIGNISLGGAFIATSSVNQFSSGDVITLSIPFTTGSKHVKRKGRIQWLNNEGFAIEFI